MSSQTIAGSAAEYFGRMIDSYDSLIHRAVPRYDEMTDRLLEYLPSNASNILELGCGTGNLSLRLARKYPHARITFVDASPEMLELTRARLAGDSPRVADSAVFLRLSFEDVNERTGSFDVITSCVSLHHVQDKAAMYRQLYQALIPCGTFRFADQMAGADGTPHSDINWNKWLEFCRLPGHCTDQEIQSLIDHAHAHDHYVPVGTHMRLLEQAGFVNVDCVWRNWMWGIVTADRAT